MNYLGENFTIDLKSLKTNKYPHFQGVFQEEFDVELAKLLIKNVETVDFHDENGKVLGSCPRISQSAKNSFEKLIRQSVLGKIDTRYYTPKGVGRRYANEKQSMTPQSRNIRNTLYQFNGWIDYDFVASHPTLMVQLALKYRKKVPKIEEWVRDKKPIIQELIKYHSCPGREPLDEDNIKKLINSGLYGGGIVGWGKSTFTGDLAKNERGKWTIETDNLSCGNAWYKGFKQECKMLQTLVWDNNPDLIAQVCDPTEQQFKQSNTLMSYYLGILENECLYHAYIYLTENQIIPDRQVALAYDGFTAPPPANYCDFNFHLNACNDYIFEKTGFQVKLVIKPFNSNTIIQSCIDERRLQLPLAEPAVGVLVQAEGIVFEEDEEVDTDYDEAYLLWRDIFELTHLKIINIASYVKEVYITEREEVEGEPLPPQIFHQYVHFTETQLKCAYGHESYIVTNDETGKSKKKKFIDQWITDANIRRKDLIECLPSSVYCPKNVFNIWRNSPFWKREIKTDNPKYNAAAVELLTKHIEVICGKDADANEYVLNWFASLIQKPHVKLSHLCVTGLPGIGKNILTDCVIKKITGGICMESSTPETNVWGKFNSQMASACLVILSETDKRNQYGRDGVFKALITDPTIEINGKNQTPFTTKSNHHFITFTNNPDPIIEDEGDRRHFLIKGGSDFKGNFQYFKNFSDVFEVENNLLSVYSYLLSRDISNWDWRSIPITKYHKELRTFNRNPLDEFLECWVRDKLENGDLIKGGEFNDCIIRSGAEMLADFRHYKEVNGGKYDVSGAGEIVKKIKIGLNLPSGLVAPASRGKMVYHLREIVKHYNSKYPIIGLNPVLQNLILEKEANDDDVIEEEEEEEVEDNLVSEVEDEEEDCKVVRLNDPTFITVGGKQVVLKQRVLGY